MKSLKTFAIAGAFGAAMAMTAGAAFAECAEQERVGASGSGGEAGRGNFGFVRAKRVQDSDDGVLDDKLRVDANMIREIDGHFVLEANVAVPVVIVRRRGVSREDNERVAFLYLGECTERGRFGRVDRGGRLLCGRLCLVTCAARGNDKKHREDHSWGGCGQGVSHVAHYTTRESTRRKSTPTSP